MGPQEQPSNRVDHSDQERACEAEQGQAHDGAAGDVRWPGKPNSLRGIFAYHLARDQTHKHEQSSPPLSQTFFSRCLASIANLGTGRTIRAKDKDLFENVQPYSLLLPESYEPIERTPSLAVILENIAQQTRENFPVSVSVNFFSRIGRWFRLKIQERSSSTAITYFSNNESRIVKNLISLLLRASTQDEPSLDRLVLQYLRLQQYPIPCAEMRWLQSLVNEVRNKIPLPLNLSEKSHAYLPCLYFVLQEIKNYNQDLNKKLLPLNIKISNTVLKELNKELNSYSSHYVDMLVCDLWNYYFDIEKSTDSKTKKFNHFIVTDGVSASVHLVRRQKAPRQAREESSMDVLFTQADRVVAVDLGRNPVFTAVVHDRRAMHDLAKPYPMNKVKHKVVTWGRSKWYSETGFTHRLNLTKRWTEKAPDIAEFNSEVSTAKTTDLSAIEFHARHVLSNLPAVLDFYYARRFRRLGWKTYIRTQKAFNKIATDLSGGSAKTLAVWGDARFPSAGRGSPAVPRSTLRRKVGCRLAAGCGRWTRTNSALRSFAARVMER